MDTLIPIEYTDKIACGGKAHGLRIAQKCGLPIPPTYCIPVGIHKRYLQEGNGSIEWIEEHLRASIEMLPEGQYAVRSSSAYEDSKTQSFAGLFESVLGVEKRNMPRAIRSVWSSAKHTRVTSYNAEEQYMGVVIQPMIEAELAGVFFSKNPSPQSIIDLDTMVIEYIEGVGEKLVQGEVTPTSLIGSKEDLLQCAMPWVHELIEATSCLPGDVDVEFVLGQDGTLWIVQQRPISTIAHCTHLDLAGYERRYKRELKLLDVQLLIEGCARHLPLLLRFPKSIDKWMLLSTSPDEVQELWIHKELDAEIIAHLIKHFKKGELLSELHTEYLATHAKLKEYTESDSLEAFFETIYPYQAHYYLPMLVIDALYAILQESVEEEALFFLSSYKIPSLLEIAAQKIKQGIAPEVVHKEFSFLNCHQVDARGFSIDEIKNLSVVNKVDEDEKYTALYNVHVKGRGIELVFDALREWIRIRNQDMEYLYKVYYEARPLFVQEAKKRDLSLGEFWDLTTQEITAGAKPKKSNMLARIQGETSPFFAESVKRTSIAAGLVGKTVYGSGTLKGVVLKAYHPQDIKPHPENKPLVLVTGMTTPDFIPALKKHCAALVTDEGGILCHAAIIARELTLPCIVGTGIATESLETGQTVSLDFQEAHIAVQTD